MELRPDRSLLVQTPLAMSRASEEELSHHDAEIARLVRMTLEGDSTVCEAALQDVRTAGATPVRVYCV